MNFFNNFLKRGTALNPKNTIQSALGISTSASEAMSGAISLWSDMYRNSAPWLSDKVHSLGLPAGIVAELSRLATIDMVSEITGSERAEYLNSIYQNFLIEKRKYVELALAKGGIIFKPFLSGKTVCVDFIQADSFIPVSFDSFGNLISVVFIDRITEGDTYFTRLEYHRFEDGNYVIENHAYKSSAYSDLGKEISLSSVSKWRDIEENVRISGLSAPLFAYFKTPFANGIDPYSPLGVSAFSGVCDLICEADKQYSRLLWEFESGERALYLDNSAFRRDKSGKIILPDRRLYRTLSFDDSLFHDYSPTLRDTEILSGLNSIMRKIEFGCGLSYGTISDSTEKTRTAEEIRFSKQRSYSTVCDIQISLKNALLRLIDALNDFVSLYNLAPRGEYCTSFDFDDSIVADRKTEFEEKMQLVNCGILLPYEFRMWYCGEDEGTAKSALAFGFKESALTKGNFSGTDDTGDTDGAGGANSTDGAGGANSASGASDTGGTN